MQSIFITVLSYIVPGIGHFILRRNGRAFFYLFLILSVNAAKNFIVFPNAQVSVAVSASALPILLWIMIDALVTSVRQKEGVAWAKWYNTLGFALLFLVCTVVLAAFKRIEKIEFVSHSMVPTLSQNSSIEVDTWAYRSSPPGRGDIVLFPLPSNPKSQFVMRVMAVAGDSIELKRGAVYLNREPVSQVAPDEAQMELMRSNLRHWEEQTGENLANYSILVEKSSYPVLLKKAGAYLSDFGPVLVPEGHLFVMGDNRDHSNDSRFWGMLPAGTVKAKYLYTMFSVSAVREFIDFFLKK